MSDIVPGLRRLPEPQCSPCYAAADEIERLGRLVRLQDAEIERLRLTDEEREALRCAVCDYNSMTRMMHKPTHGEIGAALARLFERLK
jgi:hypothetical protein